MALYIKTGEYTGNGAYNRSITGVGFTPKLVIIIRTTAGQGALTMASNPADTSYDMQNSSSGNANMIQALQSDGFKIGDDAKVNSNTANYKYLCVGGDSTDITTGSYTGDSNDNRSITGVGFQPALVIVKGTNNDQIVFHSSGMGNSTDLSQDFLSNGNYTNAIQALEADGFQVGTGGTVNTSATTYYWVAIKANSALLASGTYTGNGADNRSITGLGFDPSYVWTKRYYSRSVHRNTTYVGDASTSIGSGGGSAANQIQSFVTDGFEIGTDGQVNSNTLTYYWVAFKNNTPVTFIPTIMMS